MVSWYGFSVICFVSLNEAMLSHWAGNFLLDHVYLGLDNLDAAVYQSENLISLRIKQINTFWLLNVKKSPTTSAITKNWTIQSSRNHERK